MRKVPSAFMRVLPSESGSIEHAGYHWKVGEVRSGVEYPSILSDLEMLYPLVVKAFARGQEKVAISLPAEAYVTGLKAKEREQDNIIDRLTRQIKKETGVQAVVLPQGVSALHHIYDETDVLDREALTLVIDGGFNTINIAVADSQGNIPFVFTYYNELGIRDLLTVFAELLRDRVKSEVTANLQQLKQVFLSGKVDYGFNVIEVNGEKQTAVNMFIEKLWNRLVGDLARAGVGFDQIAVVGGIAYYLRNLLKSKTNKPLFVPTENAEFYTVIGMHKITRLPSIDFGFGDIKLYGFPERTAPGEREGEEI